MNSSPAGGSSSQTRSRPIDINNNNNTDKYHTDKDNSNGNLLAGATYKLEVSVSQNTDVSGPMYICIVYFFTDIPVKKK
jgi:hypothetical protein